MQNEAENGVSVTFLSEKPVDKDKSVILKQNTNEERKPIDNPQVYEDELKAREASAIATQKRDKKPRWGKDTQPNPEKCKFSPFAYHRFTRSHKEKLKNGSISMLMRCRYCFDMRQVIISFRILDGQWQAVKQTLPVKNIDELE